ncbi:MAG: nucleotidyl transferase AbiEii/AbiGii toxin family protein [Flavobacteriaceae bacterium]|nr:nucleotidyl transferase AbiEii/AbiGii toxin family protein [Flavobacteriaceae bacterium]
MLHYKTIDTKTLELLKAIQKMDTFKNLRLVGGTSLALQIGHRISIDIDLFGELTSDKIEIALALKELGELKTINLTNNIHVYSLNNIKTDIVNYPYPWLEDEVCEDQLILASIKDIAAMKLAAITGRGSKKDFIDIYYLLKVYSLSEMIQFYEKKYDDGSKFMVLKSLAYYKDADEELMPKMFDIVSWEDIKDYIEQALSNYLKYED